MSQTDTKGLHFKQDYLSEPECWRALVALLRDVFEIDIGILDQLGGMDPSSMPFGWFDADGVLAANFSVFSMPMMIEGKNVKVAALQSGAVRPGHRGKGLYRDLMRRVFAWIDANSFDLAILYTDKPAMYEPYGFKVIATHLFSGPAPKLAATSAARLLDIANAADVKLIADRINRRVPASHVFAPLSHPAMFLVNAFWDRSISLTQLESAEAVIAWRLGEDGAFHLLDVAGPLIPPLAVILAAIAPSVARVECFFSPDRLDWPSHADLENNPVPLMVRGNLSLLPSRPFVLNPMADF